MNKRDYFIKALHAGAFKRRAWLNAAFSIIIQSVPKSLKPYDLVINEQGFFFMDPENNELSPIEDAQSGQALFNYLDPITIAPYEIANHVGSEPLLTTYGNCLVNQILLVTPFGTTIPFITGYFSLRYVESIIAEKLIDNPENDDGVSKAPDGKIYVRQYLEFADNAFFLTALSTFNVQSTSAKSLTHHPDRDKVRAKLLEDNKDRLTDPAVIAQIGNALEALDRQWLSDDPTMQFYLSKESKLFGNARKRMHYMFGGESPFQDGTSMQLIVPSLQEGLDTTHMPVMNNSLRYGTYSRGSQTQLGGETTKTIYRMLGTVQIQEDDCNTPIGIPTFVTDSNAKSLIGFWAFTPKGEQLLIDKDNVNTFKGQFLRMRGPMVCKTGRNVDEGIAGKGKHICKRCAGQALSAQPGGMAAAAAGVGGKFLSLFLKRMHGSALKTTNWDYNQQLY